MKKEEKQISPYKNIFHTIVTIMLIILALILAYYIYLNLPRNAEKLLIDVNANFQQPIISSATQFYPNMKFNHNTITYRLDENCNEKKKSRMENAFNELSIKVPQIVFYPSNTNPDIEILCTEGSNTNPDKKHFIAGEGGAKEIIQTGRYNIITEGIIYLYENPKIKVKECSYPNVEIHELLHVFGFDHSEDKNSIMFPFIESCNQILDSSITEMLKEIYSQENLPDIYFDKIDALKKGRYLDFNATIKNAGSIKSQEVTLTIMDGDSIIDEKELGEIDFGAGITLKTTNLKLKSLNPEKITFIIDRKEQIKEVDKNNNKAEITLNN